MLNTLGIINYLLILIFGVVLSIMFAGIENTPKNRKAVICGIPLLFLPQLILWFFLDFRKSGEIYPFIIHIPNILFIKFYFKRSTTVAIVSVLCAYLCFEIPQWFATLAFNLTDSRLIYFIVNSLCILPMFYLLKRYVIFSVKQLMNISDKSLLLFAVVPFVYYIFDYATTTYTSLLYQGSKIAVIFMPSVVSIFYFIFIFFYYNELQRRNDAENEILLLSVQMKQSKKELDAFWYSQEKAAIYRHDMRHHMNLISGFLADGDRSKAIDYIACTQSSVDELTSIPYCENTVVNLVLSHFASKAQQNNIRLSTDVQIPQNIMIAETELCALLSNGLENAIHACTEVSDDELKKIHIHCVLHKDHLLILLENSYTGEIITENGLPSNDRQGQGFGVRSMVMIINKYNGYYSYTAAAGIFTLKIVLPLR